MKKRLLAAGLLAVSLLLNGCGSQDLQVPDSCPRPSSQLTVYVSHQESVYLPIVREFEERTGIWVEVVSGGTNEMLQKIEQEQNSPQADVMFAGGVESLSACADCFAPYVSREAGSISDAYLESGSCWTPFSALPTVLIYNTKLVNARSLRGWEDLMKPEFQGRIAFADPAVSGSSFTALVTLMEALKPAMENPMDSFRQALGGNILSGSGEVIEEVSSGRALVGITLEETALKAIAAGDHIGMVYPVEGTSCLPDGIALIKGGPHPENAKKFLDFTVSADVQTVLVEQECRRSVRTDLPHSRSLKPLGKLEILPYDSARVSESREKLLAQWSRLSEVTP